MGSCKNCSSWKPIDARVSRYVNYPAEYRQCLALGDECGANEPAFVSDSDGTGLGLMTTGEFGCALFEPRPETHGSWCG